MCLTPYCASCRRIAGGNPVLSSVAGEVSDEISDECVDRLDDEVALPIDGS
jgi:hypothetical protein